MNFVNIIILSFSSLSFNNLSTKSVKILALKLRGKGLHTNHPFYHEIL